MGFKVHNRIQKSFFGLLINFLAVFSLFQSANCNELPLQVITKYSSSGGLGYHSGYTTLELLYTPEFCSSIVPFIDVRGNWFDKGRFAANVGIGARYLSSCEDFILGGNIYYDYRNTNFKDYHQLGAGFEYLSCPFDIRGNVYVPVSGKRSETHKTFFNLTDGFFAFQRRFNYCLWGGDIEVGTSINYFSCLCRYVDLYAAIGPYYYVTNRGAVGGRFRLMAGLNDYITIEGRVTHDRLFKTHVQGVVSVEIPFCNFMDLFCDFGNFDDCCCENWICKKLYAPVFRNEIIPVKKTCHWKSNF